jgi:putrescine---pyruvate transaminase
MSDQPLIAERATREWQDLDGRHFLHPFTDFQALARQGARVIERAEGIWLWDTEGRRILDAMSGLWCVNVGYGRRELADAATAQLQQLPFYNAFFQTATPPAIALAEKLAELTPPSFQHVFFAGSGSEGNDTIVRMVRRYWDLLGQPERQVIISRVTPITAAPWRVPRSAAWRPCTPRAACPSRASCTSSSRTGGRWAGPRV